MGRIEPTDQVLWVQKLMPTTSGGSIYKLTDEHFYCFAEDVRHAAVILEQEHVRRGRSADKPDPNHERWRLDSEYKEDICSRLPLDEDVPLRQHLNL